MACFVPCFAEAHTLGLSTATFEADAKTGRVEATFVFASAEPALPPLDRDHDGVVTDRDVKAASEDLRAFLSDGVEVSGDGARCPATFTGASLSEVDGLVLTATYACPRNASSLEAVLYYLSALPPGHREVVRVSAGSATAEAVLSGERRAITLQLPTDPGKQLRVERQRRGWRLAALASLFVAATLSLLSLLVWRWRTAPRRTRSASSPSPRH